MARYYRIRREIDSDDAKAELDRLSGGFDEELLLRYEGAARAVFERAQAIIHVETGALKSTGKYKAKRSKDRFRAEIKYGGQPKGVYFRPDGSVDKAKHPVRYARIEAARTGGRKHSGSHDWLRFVESDWKAFESATLDWLEGRRRARRTAKFKKGGRRRR